ncbi:hypothetical protein M8818_003547 [Zalaria obscura]|uniref:Uncharacterized protein n=1 Tax=Zalaria obscura TaxID=2024903 RepID=A0ACC3SGF3_9PEZI
MVSACGLPCANAYSRLSAAGVTTTRGPGLPRHQLAGALSAYWAAVLLANGCAEQAMGDDSGEMLHDVRMDFE